MHWRNLEWWKSCANRFPRYFNHPDLTAIEFGSYSINGSIRQCFPVYKKYIGVDWRPQPGFVDLVCLAHEVKLPERFDTVASASLLEHDPYWSISIANMVDLMKDNGALFLSWGAALNQEHCLQEAPDGKFHSLKASYVLSLLEDLGLHIYEFRYEGNLYPNLTAGPRNGMGEVVLIALKNRNLFPVPSIVDPFEPEDTAEWDGPINPCSRK